MRRSRSCQNGSPAEARYPSARPCHAEASRAGGLAGTGFKLRRQHAGPFQHQSHDDRAAELRRRVRHDGLQRVAVPDVDVPVVGAGQCDLVRHEEPLHLIPMELRDDFMRSAGSMSGLSSARFLDSKSLWLRSEYPQLAALPARYGDSRNRNDR